MDGFTPTARLSAALGICLLLALAAFGLGLSGCATKQPPTAPASDILPIAPSTPGTFTAGQRIVLETGASLTVPQGWRVYLLTRGALITSEPAVSGVIGSIIEVPKAPHWGSGTVSVYGPNAGFDEQMSVAEAAYQSSLRGSAPAGASIQRMTIPLAGDATATAYITSWAGKPPRREVGLFVRQDAADPLLIVFELQGEPPDVASQSTAQLPQFLLEYIGFQPR